MNNHENYRDRSLGEVLAEIRAEVIEFVDTRVHILKSEMQEAVTTIKRAAPSLLIGVVLLGTAYILLTLAAVGVVAVAFWNNPYKWFFAFLIVGVLWFIAGALSVFLGIRAMRLHKFTPRRTIEVLKADKVWLQYEVGSRL